MVNPLPRDSDSNEKFVFYRYDPTLAGAVVYVGIFSLTTAYHFVQLVSTRTWYFIPMAIGGLMEATGYIGRILSHYNKAELGPYLMQTLLLLVSPPFLSASIYMILSRLMRFVGAETYSILPIRWVTKIFVVGDVLSMLLQATGGGIMGSGKAANLTLGEHIILVGLFVQIAFFGFFLIVIIFFHYRIRRRPTPESYKLLEVPNSRLSWVTLLYALYVGSAFILIRSVFRVIEYIQGNSGYLLRSEVWLYIFDGLLMFGVLVLFNVIHPSKVMPKGPSIHREHNFSLEEL